MTATGPGGTATDRVTITVIQTNPASTISFSYVSLKKFPPDLISGEQFQKNTIILQKQWEEQVVSEQKIKSKHYQKLSQRFPDVVAAVENLGSTVRNAGPLDRKTSELIQLAVAASSQSTGSVHSHTRRALQAGATKEEIYHTLLLLVSTIGFPKVAAALAWISDIVDSE
jgi:AhpD family alkylhydroperoxidase